MPHTSERHKALFWGGMLIIIGMLLLLDQWGILSFGDFWPLAIIAVGIWMLVKSRSESSEESKSTHNNFGDQKVLSDTDRIDYSNSMGDLSITVNSKNFAGGIAKTTFGSIKLDLSLIQLAEGEQLLELNTVFGDIKVTVPPSVSIMVIGTNTAGDMNVFEEKRSGFRKDIKFVGPGFDTATTRLKISTSQVFGDLNVW